MVLIKDTLIFLRPDIKSGLCLWKKKKQRRLRERGRPKPNNEEGRAKTEDFRNHYGDGKKNGQKAIGLR